LEAASCFIVKRSCFSAIGCRLLGDGGYYIFV